MAAFAPPYGRGTRGQHFTDFQYQPPGRQPFGLKVKSPRAFGPAPLPEGGPWGNRPKAYPGGKRQPRFRREQRAGWADAPSLELRPRERQSYQGASGGPDSAANRAAGRADTPRWMAVASQNCPQLYQGESGGLEPATKPVAGQAGAPLHSLSP